MPLILTIVIAASAFLFSVPSFAEPWLSNRYAQNCAACHAPGRVNRPGIKRRCTLNCQGCHVNPNGGGLRNNYGKYNQNKWLHSFDSDIWKQGSTPPAPYKDQPFYHKRVDAALKKASPQRQRQIATRLYKVGTKTKYLNAEQQIDETLYDKHHAAEEFTVEDSDVRYEMRIPEDDPYRLRRREFITAGADLRYFLLNADLGAGKKTYTFPMAAEIGLRYMPINKVSAVLEARFLNGPQSGSAWTDVFAQSQAKSAYLLVDDLMYNSYAMLGLYRPLFGNYTPDHTSLFSELTGLNQYAIVHGVTIGTAPNVPFLNIHMFTPTPGATIIGRPGSINSGESGFAANLGARFVSYGASAVFSYWSSKNEKATNSIKKDMYSVNLGGAIGKAVGTFDLTSIEREIEGQSKDKGSVATTELKYRIWREFYLQTSYAVANTTPSLTEGSSSQVSYGVKTFLLAGTEVELLAGNLASESPANGKTNSDYYLMQFHMFF